MFVLLLRVLWLCKKTIPMRMSERKRTRKRQPRGSDCTGTSRRSRSEPRSQYSVTRKGVLRWGRRPAPHSPRMLGCFSDLHRQTQISSCQQLTLFFFVFVSHTEESDILMQTQSLTLNIINTIIVINVYNIVVKMQN